ncbi:MAG: hypothetical protein GY795_41570 [Desulfobacterales bacterium]|nr:hypothetical protein [Desulfobacterales bacterium]
MVTYAKPEYKIQHNQNESNNICAVAFNPFLGAFQKSRNIIDYDIIAALQAPTGRIDTAQGNALGHGVNLQQALKGRINLLNQAA